MAGSKTLAWVRSLDSREKKEFAKSIENKRSGRLARLFQALLSLPDAAAMPSNSALFVTIFSEEYLPEKDYLLRNEIRHLNTALKEFMAGRQAAPMVADEFDKDLLLLAGFVERAEVENFEKAFRSLLRKAEEQDDAEVMAAAWRLQTRLLSLRPPLHEPKMRQGLESVKESIYWQKRAMLRTLLGEWVHECRFQRMIAATLQARPSLEAPPLLGFEPVEIGPINRYLLQKGLSYGVLSQERIAALKELENLLATLPSRRFAKSEEEIWLLASLALENYLVKDYADAVAVFERMQVVPEVEAHPQWPLICFNQIGALLKMRDYAAALAAMELHGPAIEKVAGMQDRYLCQKAMNLVFNGMYEKAKEVLKGHVRQTNTDSYIYFRLVTTIGHHMRGNHLAALQEVENLLQVSPLRNAKVPINNLMARLLERFMRAHADMPTPKAKNALQELRKEVQELEPDNRDVLVIQWLEEALAGV
jgi:hypothetical protein